MNALTLEVCAPRLRFGLKGPRAYDLLTTHGIALPQTPNTWTSSVDVGAAGALLVARLGTGEFFLEGDESSKTCAELLKHLYGDVAGVYPVLREDAAFLLSGDTVHDVLTQVCNVNFADLSLEPRPVVMTLMIGIAVLIVPEDTAGGRRYRIWCDPTFGSYLAGSLGNIVLECGGRYTGVPA
jgi:sarcosine oxidase, subunit gamma